MGYKIYCDMDGVLTNFMKQVNKYGSSYLELLNTPDISWSKINSGGIGFWENMEWMNNGRDLWNYIKKYNPVILSAPSSEPDSSVGKKRWVEREIGSSVKLELCHRKDKQKFSDSNSILIDDHESNIRRWRCLGGIGIHHDFNVKRTISILKEFGL